MKPQKMLRSPFALFALFLVCSAASLFAQTSPAQTPPPTGTAPVPTAPAQTSPVPQLSTRDAATQQASAAASSFDQVVDRAVEREHLFLPHTNPLHPPAPTYPPNLT